jgi:hypothetical protein
MFNSDVGNGGADLGGGCLDTDAGFVRCSSVWPSERYRQACRIKCCAGHNKKAPDKRRGRRK